MIKEEYLQWRDLEEVSPAIYYEYYLDFRDVSKELLSLEDFEAFFKIFMTEMANGANTLQTARGIRHLNYPVIINKVYAHLNKKFGV